MKVIALLFVDPRLGLMFVLQYCFFKAAARFGFHIVPMVVIAFLLRPLYRLIDDNADRPQIDENFTGGPGIY